MKENIIGARVKILDYYRDGLRGVVVSEKDNMYTIKLDSRSEIEKYYLASRDQIEVVEEKTKTAHVTITTEKLRQLIKENYKWNNYTLKDKVNIVTNFAYFENDKEILEFLIYMEE